MLNILQCKGCTLPTESYLARDISSSELRIPALKKCVFYVIIAGGEFAIKVTQLGSYLSGNQSTC